MILQKSLSLSVYVCVRYFLKNAAVYISTSRNDLYMYICICIITQGIVWWTTFPMCGCGKSSFFSNYFCLLILSMFVICLYAVITCEKHCTFSLKLLFFILWLLLLGIYLFLLAIFNFIIGNFVCTSLYTCFCSRLSLYVVSMGVSFFYLMFLVVLL